MPTVAVHSSTVQEDAMNQSTASRSPTRSGLSVTTAGKRTDRNLDNMDMQKEKGTVINSPRSLLACAKEGVDHATELHHRNVKSFMLASKGDVDVAKLKQSHHETRRLAVIERCRERRRQLIEQLENQPSNSANDGSEEPTEAVPKREKRPPVKSTQEMAADSKRDEFQRQKEAEASEDSDDSDEEEQDPEEARLDEGRRLLLDADPSKSTRILSPEEYQRQRAMQRKLKVARQVDKLREVIKRNQQKEEAQMEYLAKMKQKARERELLRQEQQERDEAMQYLRERAARKRDAELAVQREMKERANEVRQEQLREQRELKLQELEQRDAERRQQQLVRQQQRELEAMEQREEQRRRLEQIQRQNEELLEERRRAMDERLEEAEEQRQHLQAQRDEELSERRKRNHERTEENAAKRQKAEERYEERIGGYKERAAKAEQFRQEREKELQALFKLRRQEEADDARRREEMLQAVHEKDEQRAQELLQRLQEDEKRREEAAAERRRAARLRLAEKELLIEDRTLQVSHIQRRHEQESLELGDKHQAKLDRIERMRHETRQMDEERRKLQAQAVKLRAGRDSVQQPTPGPGEYAVVTAADKLNRGPTTRFGNVVRKPAKIVADQPGPGAYGNPVQAIRPTKGAKLPPRSGAMLQLVSSTAVSTAGPSPKRASSVLSSTRLPSIDHPRAASSADSHHRRERAQQQRPTDLKDEDFATDDEFD